MSSRKWLAVFFASIAGLIAAIAVLNITVDPFGVFGDRFYKWYSFNFTENPKVAKVAYLDEHYSNYNGYILGSSGASSLSPHTFGEYLDISFFNLFVYGADMEHTQLFAEYVIDNYEVDYLILNLGLINAAQYQVPRDNETNALHAAVEGSPKSLFYLKYMKANPRYALAKIADARKNSYLQQPFDVFEADTGSYDKSVRDVEAIGSLDTYLSAYPEFKQFQQNNRGLYFMDACVNAVKEIKAACDEKGIELLVIIPPMYAPDIRNYAPEEIKEFWIKLAEVTDFWDFCYSSVSLEPRYFYDVTHYRNAVGDMMAAKIFENGSVYVPQDFGVYVTKENAAQQGASYARDIQADLPAYTATVPVLMYHHLAAEGNGSTICSIERFEEHLAALQAAGYAAVSFDDLQEYVNSGLDLPEKPVVITFDDGYTSNYEYAFPLLEQYGMKATVFAIGISIGKDTYKDTGMPMFPHFDEAQMAEMAASKVVSIQSHTFDMHQSEQYDGADTYRKGILQKEGETEQEYIAAFQEDFLQSKSIIESATGEPVLVFSYPNGLFDTLSAVLLNEMGVKVTLTTEPGVNTIVKGLPQSLLALKRLNISDEFTPEALVDMLDGYMEDNL